MKLVEQPNSGIAQSVVDAPEGTRPTYECVRDRHVNAVKLDVTYTADKVVVMSHDTNLKRTTGQDLPIIGTNYADLKEVPFLECGDYSDERIMTLDETLDIVKGCERFYLDFKYSTPEMIQAVFNIFDKHEIPCEKILIATFNMTALRDAKELRPEVRRVLHIEYALQKDGTFSVNGQTNYADFAAVKAQMGLWKEELDLYGFNLPSHSKYTTPELIRALKAEGSWLTVWYVHTTIIADTFANSGVDGFVTGAASAIRDYLKAKATKP